MRAEAATRRRGEQVLTGLLVTPASRQARRTLGTIAWAVLEDVALDAEVDDLGHLVAVTNVRRVAAHLGIGKDTAARALVRLADAGFVQRRSHRGRGGEFASSTYVVLLDETKGMVRSGGPPCPTAPVSGSRDRVRAPPDRTRELASAEAALERARRHCRPGHLSRNGRQDRRHPEALEARYAELSAEQGRRQQWLGDQAGPSPTGTSFSVRWPTHPSPACWWANPRCVDASGSAPSPLSTSASPCASPCRP